MKKKISISEARKPANKVLDEAEELNCAYLLGLSNARDRLQPKIAELERRLAESGKYAEDYRKRHDEKRSQLIAADLRVKRLESKIAELERRLAKERGLRAEEAKGRRVAERTLETVRTSIAESDCANHCVSVPLAIKLAEAEIEESMKPHEWEGEFFEQAEIEEE